MITFSITFVVFLFAFLSAPFLLNQVYGTSESKEKYPLAYDENGDKLDYNECPGYDDGIDPSQYSDMTAEELGKVTDNVDARILELNTKGSSINEDEQEELECLESIRTVENEAISNLGEIANDISELTDLYSQQMDLNEKWDSLSSKYN